MKYRKKPVVVEAEQWFPGNTTLGVKEERGAFYVVTIHGQQAWLSPGDWVITEPNGINHYPCKPDIFASTYESVEASPDKTAERVIIVNGKSYTVHHKTMDYENVAALAGFNRGSPSMTYHDKSGREGRILSAGQSVELGDGAVFSVAYTGNA